jgi:competence protein ComEC
VATLGLAPLALVFFQQVSLVGFVANLVAIPLVTLLLTPLALLGVLVAWLWPLGAVVVQALGKAARRAGEHSGGGVDGADGPAWAQWAVSRRRRCWSAAALARRLLGAPLALGLLVPPRELPAEGQFEVVAADVGQGTALLVRTRSHALLFDAGPAVLARERRRSARLVPLLRTRGEQRLDVLMLSHRDVDHVGGAVRAGAVRVASPVELARARAPAARRSGEARRCEQASAGAGTASISASSGRRRPTTCAR